MPNQPYKLSEEQQSQIRTKLLAIQLAQNDLQIFMSGLRVGAMLDTNIDWQLNIDTWYLIPVEKSTNGQIK